MADARDRRPSPDAFLDLAAREGRGKLKIFLGASPGVGKTFAMLTAARRLMAEHKDVVVGVVETHGRAETAELLAGLEVLPPRVIAYRGRMLQEFDLDAALRRKPALVIVDELAHSNVPGSRHPKRYQDVQELLDAGIDVWTALNIQHLESLADVVAAITGITVRERIPDTVVERADDVVLIDVTPDELVQRLKAGKVYLGENASRAAENFLKLGNLTALRELALRHTTQRIDDQMVDYLRRNAIEGPWPTAERLLVCVGGDALSQEVVRTGARMANALNGTWMAIHVSPSGHSPDVPSQRRVDDALSLAARLGAEVSRRTAGDLAAEILRLAGQENITQILIGQTPPSRLKKLLGKSLPTEIMRRARGVAVHVITSKDDALPQRFALPRISLKGLPIAALAVAAATLVGAGLERVLQLPNLSMIYLAAVLFCAIGYGTGSAIAAALLSFLAYNFFFIDPRYTLTVASPSELLSLFIFLLVAIFTGSLAGRLRQQRVFALAQVRQLQALHDLSRKISAAANMDDIGWIAVTHLATLVQGQAILLLEHDGELAIVSAMPPEDELDAADWAAARWSLEKGEKAGWNSETLPNAHFQFRPLQATGSATGVAGFRPPGDTLSSETERMVQATLDQVAVAVERTRLGDQAARAQADAEGEKLRSALLSSISHDLRTPLSSILGSASSLRSLGAKMSKAVRDDLLANIEEEATRLSRFVVNLLDMTKLEAMDGPKELEKVDLGEVAMAAVRRATQAWPSRKVSVSIDGNLRPVMGRAALLEQLVFNLLDNAEKYASSGTATTVTLSAAGGNVRLAVEDKGPGIPPAELEQIFQKFYRVHAGDGRPPGTGLGLAICRAIATACGGTIHAESPVAEGRGTRIVLRLPEVMA
jgi:two-component system sensor histidine kinase KdpD